MALLSIHSSVVCGHVGNSAAVFPVQCLGMTVWPISTVTLSNHPGHGQFTGAAVDAGLIDSLIAGLEGHGALADCRGVLTGYFTSASQVESAIRAIGKVGSGAIAICDPVLGDEGKGLYVKEDVASAVRDKLIGKAQIITPNAFEVGWLTGLPTGTVEQLCQAAEALREQGPRDVLVTSLPGMENDDRIGMLLVNSGGYHLVETPRLPVSVHGAGDMTAALYAAHLLAGKTAIQALEHVADTVYAVVEKTMVQGLKELALIECRDLFGNPPKRFSAQTLDLSP